MATMERTPMVVFNVRAPASVESRADALVSYVGEAYPEGGCATRASVLRRALLAGLRVLEASAQGAKQEVA